jgi:hypothetical protein
LGETAGLRYGNVNLLYGLQNYKDFLIMMGSWGENVDSERIMWVMLEIFVVLGKRKWNYYHFPDVGKTIVIKKSEP